MAEEREYPGLDVVELFTDAVAVFRGDAGVYMLATLFVLGLEVATNYFPIAGLLLMGPMIMGLFKIALCGVRKQPVLLGDAFCGFDYFVSAVALNLAVFVIALIGLPFCLLPAFFIFVLFLPAYFFLLDGAQGFFDAVSMCRAMVKRDLRSWLWAAGLFLVLFAGGLALLVLPLLATLPIAIISQAILYERHINGQPLSGAAPDELAP